MGDWSARKWNDMFAATCVAVCTKAVQAEALNKKVLSRASFPTSLLRGETYMYIW